MMRDDKENLIVDLTFEFAIRIIEFADVLYQQKKFHLSNQLFKSGTSIGANVHEAQNAESKADFIHKMKLAAKEADETMYWLRLCRRSPLLPDPGDLIELNTVIMKVLSKIISSSKRGR